MEVLPLATGSGATASEVVEEDEEGLEAPASRGAHGDVGAKRADGERIRKLVIEQNAFVWRSLVRLGVPRADAEDSLQQVFLVAARRIADIHAGAERSFLYGVCLRVASRARRSQMRRREVVGDECPEQVDPQDRPDEMVDRARARALLEEILGTMPIELRSIFTLFELEQLTMSEIAELMGIPQGTVASRLRRARELFTDHRRRIEARLRSKAPMRAMCTDREAT
jgi:RNA polymerase sigma-70 factor (ECF subfamily)